MDTIDIVLSLLLILIIINRFRREGLIDGLVTVAVIGAFAAILAFVPHYFGQGGKYVMLGVFLIIAALLWGKRLKAPEENE